MWREDPASVRPMLASIGDAPLVSTDFAYEPKYDGIRALVSVEPARGGPLVRFWSRLGNEKTRQFPEVAEAVRRWARSVRRPLLLDGEIVAIDGRGEPMSFQYLQGRMHLTGKPSRGGSRGVKAAPAQAVLVVFDLLRDGDHDLRARPLRERRARLERLFTSTPAGGVRLSEQAVGDGRVLQERAQTQGWEGLLAKRLDSPYRSGRRSPDWRKLKLIRTQTCVIGGWTEPRGSRSRFGALILGVYDDERGLRYVGHAGSGFSGAELDRVWKKLRPLETARSPFAAVPPTNERPHWVRPTLTAEVKFTEWTSDGQMRHPTYLGLRDDVEPSRVRREPDNPTGRVMARAVRTGRSAGPPAGRNPTRRDNAALTGGPAPQELSHLVAQLDDIETRGGTGVLTLPGGERLDVTNLGKTFWPAAGRRGTGRAITKGDLLRHYVRVAPFILPVLADRPLVMKRYPNGIDGKSFYQHQAPTPSPPGVRTMTLSDDGAARTYVVGGTLATLLYTAQLASLSQDPWFSRVDSLAATDYVAIDLDPPEGLPFARVRDTALWVRDALGTLAAPGFAKTSGASGLHVYIPMAPGTPYEAGLLFAQIVATMVARAHPRVATIERSLAARRGRIYVDYLQNVRGKTLASAYSARASAFAGVSTPVTWDEIEAGIAPEDFTIRTVPARLDAVGDLWAGLRRSAGADLRAVVRTAR